MLSNINHHLTICGCFINNVKLLFFDSADLSNEPEKKKNANRMKMSAYLFCQLVELLEADAMQVIFDPNKLA